MFNQRKYERYTGMKYKKGDLGQIFGVILIFLLWAFIIFINGGCSKTIVKDPLEREVFFEMCETANTLRDIDDVRDLMMNRFVYEDGIEPNNPTAEDVFRNDLKGNCQAATALARWACEQIGMDSIAARLEGEDTPHRICVAWDRENEWHIFSNHSYLRILADCWKDPMLEHFNGRYDKITVYKAEKVVQHNQGEI